MGFLAAGEDANVCSFVFAGFCHEHALILYVYLPNDDTGGEDSVLTVRFIPFSSACVRARAYLLLDWLTFRCCG